MQQNEWNSMLESLKKNNVDDKKVATAVENLSEDQKKTLDDLLSDPQLLRKLMSSPKAKSLMEMLKKKE